MPEQLLNVSTSCGNKAFCAEEVLLGGSQFEAQLDEVSTVNFTELVAFFRNGEKLFVSGLVDFGDAALLVGVDEVEEEVGGR
ncbi:MAG: hypothetical protein AAF597_01275 [Bacteroidota bacterium]